MGLSSSSEAIHASRAPVMKVSPQPQTTWASRTGANHGSYDKNHNHYFWIFPIGQKLWNVGLWYRHPESDMMKSFRACWGKYINKFFSNYTIISTPRGEFCGNIDLNTQESVYAIGDYAGCNNEKNGGGIYRAIKSAVYCAKGIV